VQPLPIGGAATNTSLVDHRVPTARLKSAQQAAATWPPVFSNLRQRKNASTLLHPVTAKHKVTHTISSITVTAIILVKISEPAM
jgi:hypothetical protein